MPDTGVYLVSPRSIAAIAAFLILSGVSKSGSPVESEMTSRPAFLRSRAFCVTAIVADGLMRKMASARKDIWTISARKNRARLRACARKDLDHRYVVTRRQPETPLAKSALGGQIYGELTLNLLPQCIGPRN